jgi:hypothetical protein
MDNTFIGMYSESRNIGVELQHDKTPSLFFFGDSWATPNVLLTEDNGRRYQIRLYWMRSLRTLKFSDTAPLASSLALPTLQVLELDATYTFPELQIPSISITRLTIFHELPLLLNEQLVEGTPQATHRQRFVELLAKCHKLKDLRLYVFENGWSTQSIPKYVGPTTGIRGGWNFLCDLISPVAGTLESLDLTAPQNATPLCLKRTWLSLLEPVEQLTHFSKLKALTVFAEALSMTARLPRSLELLRTRKPTPQALQSICNRIALRYPGRPDLDKLTFHSEYAAGEPNWYALFSRSDFGHVGLRLPECWERPEEDKAWAGIEE